MISASTVYETLLDLIRADKRGLSLSIDEYNRMSSVINQKLFALKYKDFETTTDNIGALAGFKVLDASIALVGAECSLPALYYEMIGKPRITDSGGTVRRCDLVSQLELDERTDDNLTQPSQTYPVYTIGELDGSDNLILHVYPTTITGNVIINYLREPQTPYLDYYINDTTLVRTFLDEAEVVVIPVGSTYSDGTAGDGATPVTSDSMDWEWSDSELAEILSMFCSMLGITYPDQVLLQGGNAEEIKNA